MNYDTTLSEEIRSTRASYFINSNSAVSKLSNCAAAYAPSNGSNRAVHAPYSRVDLALLLQSVGLSHVKPISSRSTRLMEKFMKGSASYRSAAGAW